jgi:hypothetical protein
MKQQEELEAAAAVVMKTLSFSLTLIQSFTNTRRGADKEATRA